MSKLLQDEKVAALVEKEVAKAIKAERARVLSLLKGTALPTDKAHAKTVKGVVKDLIEAVKAA